VQLPVAKHVESVVFSINVREIGNINILVTGAVPERRLGVTLTEAVINERIKSNFAFELSLLITHSISISEELGSLGDTKSELTVRSIRIVLRCDKMLA